MTFKDWKQPFYKDKICDKKNLDIWFNIRNIEYDWNQNKKQD